MKPRENIKRGVQGKTSALAAFTPPSRSEITALH